MNTNGINFQQIEKYFTGMNLPVPFIPDEMSENILQISDSIYGSYQETRDLYDIDLFVKDVMTKPVSDYLLFGISGYGFNSYALHYYLVRDSLALFLQLGWGGTFEDRDSERDNIVNTFKMAETLIKSVELSQQQEDNPILGKRLIVEDSSFYGAKWMILDELITSENQSDVTIKWEQSFDSVRSALSIFKSK